MTKSKAKYKVTGPGHRTLRLAPIIYCYKGHGVGDHYSMSVYTRK